MRRPDKEITDRQAVEDVIRRAEVCHLGLCADGRPYVVPVTFGYEDGSIYVHSAPEGMKLDLIRADGRVCVQFESDVHVEVSDDACRSTARYRSVIGLGRAEVVEDDEGKRRGLDAVMRHYGGEPGPYSPEAIKKVLVLRIALESVTGKQSGYGD